jgi:dienelactone hydrolase
MPTHAALSFFRFMLAMAGLVLSGASVAANSPSRAFTLDTLSPLASASELTSRLLTPVTQDRIVKFREKVDFSLQEQTIALGEEPFELFVPEPDANGKYGLMVFIWPADDIQVPHDWWKVFRDRHIIYVASRRSSNIENIFDRRVPLALHGYEYVRSRYALDPERVYIGGFSGGSRTAQRTVMAYPDVFRGVFLAGGSDALGGESGFTLPSAALSRLMQRQTRFVFSTGGNDSPNRAKDARTRRNLEMLCMQGVRLVPQNGVEHWVPDGRGFSKAMGALERPVQESEQAQECFTDLDQRIKKQLDEVAAEIAAGKLEQAGSLLAPLDAQYGGLAAPYSVELSRTIADRAGLYELP